MTLECDWIAFFEPANNRFLSNNLELFTAQLSERTLCGCLAQILAEDLKNTPFAEYIVDVEYNRNNGKLKTILDGNLKEVTINCDLIIHSRGKYPEKDNLVALEMKKSDRPEEDKNKDRERLIALTKSSYDDTYSADGITLPEHVCGYSLGIYYEINFRRSVILIEYYKMGTLFNKKEIAIKE